VSINNAWAGMAESRWGIVWPIPGADFHGRIAQVCWPTPGIATGRTCQEGK